LRKDSVTSVKNLKEKVKVYPEKNAVSIRGSTWTLWIRCVKTNDGKTLFLFKPLELKYSEKTKNFYYEKLRDPIWLEKKDINEILSVLTQLTQKDDV